MATKAQRIIKLQRAGRQAVAAGNTAQARRLQARVQTLRAKKAARTRQPTAQPALPAGRAAPVAPAPAAPTVDRGAVQAQITALQAQADRLWSDIGNGRVPMSRRDDWLNLDSQIDALKGQLYAADHPEYAALMRYAGGETGTLLPNLSEGGVFGTGLLAPASAAVSNRRGDIPELYRLTQLNAVYRQAITAAKAAGDTAAVQALTAQYRTSQEARGQLFYSTLTPEKIRGWALNPYGAGAVPTPTGPIDQGGPGITPAQWQAMTPEQREQALTQNATLALAAALAAASAGYEGVQEWRQNWTPGTLYSSAGQTAAFEDTAWLTEFMPQAQQMLSGLNMNLTVAEQDDLLQANIDRAAGEAALPGGTPPGTLSNPNLPYDPVTNPMTPSGTAGGPVPRAGDVTGGGQAGFTEAPLISGSPTAGLIPVGNEGMQEYLDLQADAIANAQREALEAQAAVGEWRTAKENLTGWIATWAGMTQAARNTYSYGGLTGGDAFRARKADLGAEIDRLNTIMRTQIGERQLAGEARAAAQENVAGYQQGLAETAGDYLARAHYMVPYLPENLIQMFAQFWTDTGDYEQALAALRQTPQYNSFFPGIRREDGTLRLTENEYLGVVAAYKDTLSEFGINSGWLQARVPELIIGDVSADEFRSRVAAMDERIMAQGDVLRRIYDEYYGVGGMTDEALLAAAIDPAVRVGLLNRQISIAELGGQGAVSGFEIGSGLATRMYQAEIGLERATSLFQTGARVLPTMSRASGRQTEGQFGLSEFLGAEAFGQAAQQEQIQRILAGEAANFTEQQLAARQEYALTGYRPR